MVRKRSHKERRPRKDSDTSSDGGVRTKPARAKKRATASTSASADRQSTSKRKGRTPAKGKARRLDQASTSRSAISPIELSDDDSSGPSSDSYEPLSTKRKSPTKRTKNRRQGKGDSETATTYPSDAEQGLGQWDEQDQKVLESIARRGPSSGDEAHDVDDIVDWRRNKRNGRVEYRVEWTGFTEHHNTWEPRSHFSSPLTETAFWRRMVRLNLGEKPSELDRLSDEESCDSESTEKLLCSGEPRQVEIALLRKRQDIRIDRAIKQGNYSSMRGFDRGDGPEASGSVKDSQPLARQRRPGHRKATNEASKKSPDLERTVTPEDGKRQRHAPMPAQRNSSLPVIETKALEPLDFEMQRDNEAAERLKQAQRFLMESHKPRRRQTITKPNAKVTHHPNDENAVIPSAMSAALVSVTSVVPAPSASTSALASSTLASSNASTLVPARRKGNYVNPMDKARKKAALISGSTLPALRKEEQTSEAATRTQEQVAAKKRVSFNGSEAVLYPSPSHPREAPIDVRPALRQDKVASSTHTRPTSDKRNIASGWGDDLASPSLANAPPTENLEQAEMDSMEGFIDWDATAEVAGGDGANGPGDAVKGSSTKAAAGLPSLPHFDSGIQLGQYSPTTPRGKCLFFHSDEHDEEEEVYIRSDQGARRSSAGDRGQARSDHRRGSTFKMEETSFVKAIPNQYHYFSDAKEHFERDPSHKEIRNELIELVRKNGGGLRTRDSGISENMRLDQSRSVIWVPTAAIAFTAVEQEAVRRHNFEFRIYDANKTLSEIWPWRKGTITMLSFGALIYKLLLYCQAQVTEEEGEVTSKTSRPPSMGLGQQFETVLLHPWQRIAFKRLLDEDLLDAFLREILGILDEDRRCEFALRNSGMDVIKDLVRLEVVAERLVHGSPENAPDNSPTLPELLKLTKMLDEAVHESLANLQRELCKEKRSFFFGMTRTPLKTENIRTCFETIEIDPTLLR